VAPLAEITCVPAGGRTCPGARIAVIRSPVIRMSRCGEIVPLSTSRMPASVINTAGGTFAGRRTSSGDRPHPANNAIAATAVQAARIPTSFSNGRPVILQTAKMLKVMREALLIDSPIPPCYGSSDPTFDPTHARRSTMAEAFIIDACRTARGRRKGSLGETHPIDLLVTPLRAIVERKGIARGEEEGVCVGCV